MDRAGSGPQYHVLVGDGSGWVTALVGRVGSRKLDPRSTLELPMRSVCCCLRHNVVEAFCHNQDSLVRGAAGFPDRRRKTTHKCNNLSSTVEMLTTCNSPAVIDGKARYWSKIATFSPVRGISVGILP